MAKLNGILKIEGTIQDMTFYKSKDGHLVRSKGGVSKQRISTDAAFARTRENNSEFGMAAKAGKLVRNTLRTFLLNAKDSRVTSRLTQVMSIIKNYDKTSNRGKRTVATGITDALAIQVLKGFDFNENASLAAVLYKPYTVETSRGVITISKVSPINDLAFPAGATDVTFKGAFANVDFANGIGNIEYTNEMSVPLDSTEVDITLIPSATPSGSGTKLFLLTIEFFQSVNGQQYSLKNGAYNALSIIEAV